MSDNSEAMRRDATLAARMRSQAQQITPAVIRARLANPPQTAPVTGTPIPPKLRMDVMNEMENLIFNTASGTPELATEEQVQKILTAWSRSESVPAAEVEPWLSIVQKAVKTYSFFFGSAPDRELNHVSPFEIDNLPRTHDGTDEYGELLPPWNPSDELEALVVVSTSRSGYRWPLRGAQTLDSVSAIVEDDRWCDLGYCTAARRGFAKPSVVPFAYGDLIVLTHFCSKCWQTWMDENVPAPPEETIYETDVEDDV